MSAGSVPVKQRAWGCTGDSTRPDAPEPPIERSCLQASTPPTAHHSDQRTPAVRRALLSRRLLFEVAAAESAGDLAEFKFVRLDPDAP